ncbi:MAG TPA: hypothetical protein VL691_21220 [Vicinamibacteria bacterium]|nr:hypothetical protein [Vicinamibacteria bacterium]
MRLAFWTPRPRVGWAGALTSLLVGEMRLVEADPAVPPAVDLDVYDVADDPAHGFVYRALRREPGVVVLQDWNLHRLVHAETAGGGDPAGYRREARRSRGETGAFVAEQVLAGRGGALPCVLPLNDRVLEASLGLVTTSPEVQARAEARLGGRPLVRLPSDPVAAALALLDLARAVHADGARLRREVEADRGPKDSLVALALDEVRPAVHELSLPRVPSDIVRLLAELLPGGQ